MTPDHANEELMRSLGKLVRGLSSLFWGLPTALVVCFYTAKAEGLKFFGVIPPLASTALIVYGVWQVAEFQKQERIWRNAIDRVRVLALVNFGLSPFLYWWYRVPNEFLFSSMVLLLGFSALFFLAFLNLALRRLGAMLPDEALRVEIRQFSGLNLSLLALMLLFALFYLSVAQLPRPPLWLAAFTAVLDRGSFLVLVLLILLPLAMTMALLWKTKEVILDSVFSHRP